MDISKINENRARLNDNLVDSAVFVHSVKPASANSESEFSKMSRMITPIRSSYTAKNAGFRMRIRSQLPIKRKLEMQMREHGVKKAKLFHRCEN